jgi:hypothetical protein
LPKALSRFRLWQSLSDYIVRCIMSEVDQKATSAGDRTRSALPPTTDLGRDGSDVRFVLAKAVDREFAFTQVQIASGKTRIQKDCPPALSLRGHLAATDTQSVSWPFEIAINIDLRQSINRTPDGVAGASHA